MEHTFRDLTVDEIEVRIGQLYKEGKGLSLLLYKNARVDMDILDEKYDITGWQRGHFELKGNIYCNVSVWDKENKQWVTKADVGAESNTAKEKGEASDSFKRACVNLGIGRELYTSPRINVWSSDCNIQSYEDKKTRGLKYYCKDVFAIKSIKIENKKIVELTIKNTANNKVVFNWAIIDRQKNTQEKPPMQTASSTPQSTGNTNNPKQETNHKCELCTTGIVDAVNKYSQDAYGHSLCRGCQDIAFKKYGRTKLNEQDIKELSDVRKVS